MHRAPTARSSWLADRGRCVERDDERAPVRGSRRDHRRDRRAARRPMPRAETLARRERRGRDGSPRSRGPRTSRPRTTSRRTPTSRRRSSTLLGYTPEELASERQHFRRLVHPDDRARASRPTSPRDADAAEGGWDDTYRVVHRDGAVRLVHGAGAAPRRSAVRPSVWHGVTIDVTAPPGRGRAPADGGRGRARLVGRLAPRRAAAAPARARAGTATGARARSRCRRPAGGSPGSRSTSGRSRSPCRSACAGSRASRRRGAPASAAGAPGSRSCSSST